MACFLSLRKVVICASRGQPSFSRPSPHPPSYRVHARSVGIVRGSPVLFGSSDIADCFSHLGIPDWLSDWFSLPGIRGEHCPWAQVDGEAPKPGDWMVPCLTVLPMGWSWSLHFAQKAHEFRLSTAGLTSENRVVDRMSTRPLRTQHDVRHAAYVDNNFFIGHCRADVNAQLNSICKELTHNDLPVHDIVEACSNTDFVGLHFDGSSHEVRISWSRLWKIKLAIDFLFQFPKISSKHLEKRAYHMGTASP